MREPTTLNSVPRYVSNLNLPFLSWCSIPRPYTIRWDPTAMVTFARFVLDMFSILSSVIIYTVKELVLAELWRLPRIRNRPIDKTKFLWHLSVALQTIWPPAPPYSFIPVVRKSTSLFISFNTIRLPAVNLSFFFFRDWGGKSSTFHAAVGVKVGSVFISLNQAIRQFVCFLLRHNKFFQVRWS